MNALEKRAICTSGAVGVAESGVCWFWSLALSVGARAASPRGPRCGRVAAGRLAAPGQAALDSGSRLYNFYVRVQRGFRQLQTFLDQVNGDVLKGQLIANNFSHLRSA